MISILYAEEGLITAESVQLRLGLEAEEASIEVVSTGRACLDRMNRGGVDVLLLDLGLPDIDGLMILNELALRGDRTPVIIVSGQGQDDMAVKAMRAGAIDFVRKASHEFTDLYPLVVRAHRSRTANPFGLPVGNRPGTERPRIILLENDADVRKELVAFLRASFTHLEVVELDSPLDLGRIWPRQDPGDAVLLGSVAPPDTPLEVLRTLRFQFPESPVVLTVQVSNGETAVVAFQMGAADYVQLVPGDRTDLVVCLGRCLRHASLLRRNLELAKILVGVDQVLAKQVAARTEQLQALSKGLIRMQENERSAIARELHGQMGPMLTGLTRLLAEVSAEVASPARERLAETRALAVDLLDTVRAMTIQLRPRVLDDLGLIPALEWYTTLFQNRTGIRVDCELSLPAFRLPTELETTIFRMVQEGLTNVALHAGVASVQVFLAHGTGRVMAEVVDRGKGFDVAAAQGRRATHSLLGLKERVELAGGTFDIFSGMGQGTRLNASFPARDASREPGLVRSA